MSGVLCIRNKVTLDISKCKNTSHILKSSLQLHSNTLWKVNNWTYRESSVISYCCLVFTLDHPVRRTKKKEKNVPPPMPVVQSLSDHQGWSLKTLKRRARSGWRGFDIKCGLDARRHRPEDSRLLGTTQTGNGSNTTLPIWSQRQQQHRRRRGIVCQMGNKKGGGHLVMLRADCRTT